MQKRLLRYGRSYSGKPLRALKKFNFKKGGPPQLGVLAQDIQKIFPRLVVEDPETGNLSVKYSIFNTMLIKCVQEQQETLNTHQKQIDKLTKLVEKIMKK
jgi:hypothetical protein